MLEDKVHKATIINNFEDGLFCNIDAGGHKLVADEPEDLGGHDKGPDPYLYLATALGTCTAMTLNMYATRKKWPVEQIKVDMIHKKIKAEDCEDCETEKGFVDIFERHIKVTGDLDREQQERMLEIANKCPVHRTLMGELKIRSKLVCRANQQ